MGGTSLAAHPSGKFLFSMGGTNQSNIALNTDAVAASGALSVVSTVGDSTLAGGMSINPAGTALYVSSIDAAQGNWGWKTYSVHSNGSLQFVSGQIDQVNGPLVFTPDGSNAYSCTCYHLGANIEHFTVASDGTLTFTGEQFPYSYTFGQCINAIAIMPSGSMIASVWANARNQGPADNFLLLFGLDSSTHKLSPPGPPSPASGVGRDTVFDPSGNFLIVAQDNGVGASGWIKLRHRSGWLTFRPGNKVHSSQVHSFGRTTGRPQPGRAAGVCFQLYQVNWSLDHSPRFTHVHDHAE